MRWEVVGYGWSMYHVGVDGGFVHARILATGTGCGVGSNVESLSDLRRLFLRLLTS